MSVLWISSANLRHQNIRTAPVLAAGWSRKFLVRIIKSRDGCGFGPLAPPFHLSVTHAAVVVESKWWLDRAEPSRSCIQDTYPFAARRAQSRGAGLRSRAFPGLLISDRGSMPRLSMRRQSEPTNATPRPLAPLDECPHRDAHLRSAARHCHPPITRPSFMSRLERIRTIPVVYGGNRAVLFEKRSAAAPPDSPMRWPGSPGLLSPRPKPAPAASIDSAKSYQGQASPELSR